MANQIPVSGASNAAGGYALTAEQGRLLVNGILDQTGAAQLAGDRRSTSKRKSTFPILIGEPTADLVGEGAAKPVTGLEFGTSELNVRKVATIIPFTDEILEDLEAETTGTEDITSEVDARVRRAIARKIDTLIIGKANGTNFTPTNGFDTMLRSTTNTVELGTEADALRRAVSAAMGKLEAAGYSDRGQMGLLLAADAAQHVRDARSSVDATKPAYEGGQGVDPFYGLSVGYSHNLNSISAVAAVNSIVGFVVYRPNLHLRIRTDVRLKVSNDAIVNDGVQDRNAFQEDLTLMRFETRQGFLAHDLNRAVIAITNAV